MNASVPSSLALVIVVTMGGAASAQDRHFGIKAGPSFATVAFDPDQGSDYDRRISADGGGYAVLPIARQVALQVEALFTSRGGKLYDPDENLTGSVLLQYMDVPVLVRVDAWESGSRAFHVFAGPYAGFRLSARRQVSEEYPGYTSGVTTDMSSEVERFELGLMGGVGVHIGHRLMLDGRYSHGLSPLNKDKNDGIRIRNRAISFMAGVRF